MKQIIRVIFFGLLTVGPVSAHAQIVPWTLPPVAMDDGSEVSGSFSWNAATNEIVDFSFVLTDGTNTNFPAATLDASTSVASISNSGNDDFLRFVHNTVLFDGRGLELRLGVNPLDNLDTPVESLPLDSGLDGNPNLGSFFCYNCSPVLWAAERGALTSAPASTNFSIVIIPDTQIYVEENPEIFEAQIQWILDNEGPDAENIVYVAHLGDLKDNPGCDNLNINNGTGGGRSEWDIVDDAFERLDTARGGAGIPYGVVPGNHDFDQIGSGCPTYDGRGNPGAGIPNQRPLTLYNRADYFHPSRFVSTSWYGDPGVRAGNFRTDSNEDNFILFDGTCGLQFIAINLAYKEGADPLDAGLVRLGDAEVFWADELLKAYPDRLGIVTSHYLMNQNRSTPFNTLGGYGRRVYDGLTNAPDPDPTIGPNPNLLMMLSAHKRGEAWLVGTDGRTVNGLPPVHAILSDYQSTDYPASPGTADFSSLTSIMDGGNGGFMRIMRFDTATQMVNVETFSPAVDFTGLTYPDSGASTPANRSVLLSTYDIPADGTDMNANTASNFSFSFAGYVTDSTCAAP